MKVFDNLDKEQAGMYRWFRKNLTTDMLFRLTGYVAKGKMTELEIDRELREAYHRDRAFDAPFAAGDRSKIRSGILPPTLGVALVAFREAIEDNALAQAHSDCRTVHEKHDREVTTAFLALCEEMAKLR